MGLLGLALNALEDLLAAQDALRVLAGARLADEDVLDVGQLGPAVAGGGLADEQEVAAADGLEVAGVGREGLEEIGPDRQVLEQEPQALEALAQAVGEGVGHAPGGLAAPAVGPGAGLGGVEHDGDAGDVGLDHAARAPGRLALDRDGLGRARGQEPGHGGTHGRVADAGLTERALELRSLVGALEVVDVTLESRDGLAGPQRGHVDRRQGQRARRPPALAARGRRGARAGGRGERRRDHERRGQPGDDLVARAGSVRGGGQGDGQAVELGHRPDRARLPDRGVLEDQHQVVEEVDGAVALELLDERGGRRVARRLAGHELAQLLLVVGPGAQVGRGQQLEPTEQQLDAGHGAPGVATAVEERGDGRGPQQRGRLARRDGIATAPLPQVDLRRDRRRQGQLEVDDAPPAIRVGRSIRV